MRERNGIVQGLLFKPVYPYPSYPLTASSQVLGWASLPPALVLESHGHVHQSPQGSRSLLEVQVLPGRENVLILSTMHGTSACPGCAHHP